jgi:hypothetical protein
MNVSGPNWPELISIRPDANASVTSNYLADSDGVSSSRLCRLTHILPAVRRYSETQFIVVTAT